MRVVVIGGGFGGLASAARLAKLRHQVTLLESADVLGGALGAVRHQLPHGEVVWDAGAHHTLLPAVVRDLFRKSGRPLERELDLEPLEFVREHRFADGSTFRIPGGSRAAQIRAGNELGAGLGTAWASHVDPYGRDWELLRRDFFERPWQPELASHEVRAVLGGRESLARRVKALPDARLRAAATWSSVLEGHDPRRVPAWAGLSVYLEQNFGVWRSPGGMHQLAEALTQRLATRKVEVALGTRAVDLILTPERVSGVLTEHGRLEADAVVVACDPRTLPALAPHLRPRGPAGSHSTVPPDLLHLALDEAALTRTSTGLGPDLLGPEGHEIVFHPARPSGTDPVVAVRTGGTAPAGVRAWTLLLRHGDRRHGPEAALEVLAARGLDLRGAVLAQVPVRSRDQLATWHGSPLGPLWEGPRSLARRLAVRTPIDRVVVAGAHAATGAGLPFTGLSGALVAQVLGKA